ncbi:hypothetical protein C1645_827112 [Glomus cerebriforme]|uniref:Uncharacterized protein n=1 Tax=Glomus cerebriforme TaxID=658196 RepID=A0A397SYQ0_9GLOM|nr:hypothetical protein C1645_827112 [Glomus cerebriforme]
MSDKNDQLHKQWFQRLFKAFLNGKTAIKFSKNDIPPDDFLEIFNKGKEESEEDTIKYMSIESKIVWSEKGKQEIINQAIRYIDENFHVDDNIYSLNSKERGRLDREPDNKSNRKEWKMQKDIISKLNGSNSVLPGFQYLFKYGWKPTKSNGENDLILTNGKGIFAIVETKRVKNVPGNKKAKEDKLSSVLEQARRYKKAFIKENGLVYKSEDEYSFDIIAVIGVGITDEKDSKRIKYPSPFDQNICEALASNRDGFKRYKR